MPRPSTPRTRRSLLIAGGGLLAATTARTLAGADLAPYRPTHAFDYPTVPNLGLEYRSPKLRPFVDPLPIPPQRPIGGTLRIAEARHRFHRDLPAAPSWGYGGLPHSGPVLLAQPGDAPPTTFTNALGKHLLARDIDLGLDGTSREDRTHPQTVVHLHGAPNRPEDDGHPNAAFRPGESATYRFRLPDESATLWYHDHAMGSTRLSVYAGLAAQVWVRDRFDTGRPDNPLGLPTGAHEIPLLIADKLFFPDGRLRYQGTPLNPQDQWGGGLCGDVIVVNGKAWPYLAVDRAVYRFRVVNGAPLNDYRLVLSDRSPFWVIGSDGGLLDEPVLVEELDIAPGERYDLLIDFTERNRAQPSTSRTPCRSRGRASSSAPCACDR